MIFSRQQGAQSSKQSIAAFTSCWRNFMAVETRCLKMQEQEYYQKSWL
jgi:hypothetical protein